MYIYIYIYICDNRNEKAHKYTDLTTTKNPFTRLK